MKTRDELAEYLTGQARWREMKADEYPDDQRNGRSAEGLYRLAEDVRGLPDNDPLLARLAALAGRTGLDVAALVPSDPASRFDVSRFRFDDAREDGRRFLARLVDVAEGEYERAHEEATIQELDRELDGDPVLDGLAEQLDRREPR